MLKPSNKTKMMVFVTAMLKYFIGYSLSMDNLKLSYLEERNMKQLLDFNQSATENEYMLRVSAFDFSEKVKEIRKELEQATVKYTTIDSDNIQAEISGTYEKVMESVTKLEERGWEW